MVNCRDAAFVKQFRHEGSSLQSENRLPKARVAGRAIISAEQRRHNKPRRPSMTLPIFPLFRFARPQLLI